jgi:hypothetical protein
MLEIKDFDTKKHFGLDMGDYGFLSISPYVSEQIDGLRSRIDK